MTTIQVSDATITGCTGPGISAEILLALCIQISFLKWPIQFVRGDSTEN
jgi:hypothetical protein